MPVNRYNQRSTTHPIENQKTAAWANIARVKKASRVPIPSIIDVEEAKDYVEENQK